MSNLVQISLIKKSIVLKSLAVGEPSGSEIAEDYSIMDSYLPKGRDWDKNKGSLSYSQCYCSMDREYIQNKSSKRSYFYVEF